MFILNEIKSTLSTLKDLPTRGKLKFNRKKFISKATNLIYNKDLKRIKIIHFKINFGIQY